MIMHVETSEIKNEPNCPTIEEFRIAAKVCRWAGIRMTRKATSWLDKLILPIDRMFKYSSYFDMIADSVAYETKADMRTPFCIKYHTKMSSFMPS